jgi:pyruvate/2-oxoglutarate dehydrogenase complex dihydrolipoamide dehydrogenase (E3) component
MWWMRTVGRCWARWIIARMGARAAQPAIAGLDTIPYLTNETVFSLTERPRRLAVIGGGPIGCELAQAFQRLGCEVTLFHQGSRLLSKEDEDAAEIVRQALVQDGIRLVLNSQIQQVTQTDAEKILHFTSPFEASAIPVDAILVGTGRVPNVNG